MSWQCVLELDQERHIKSGAEAALCDAIRGGADLRVYTEFRHNEHIDLTSDNPEIVKEVSEFRVTCLLDDRWTAGFMTLRQPVDLPVGFGPRSSMSFFLYNQNGQQAIARAYLDGPPTEGTPGPSPMDPSLIQMAKYHQQDGWDADTNAPISNFIYDFEVFRYFVRDDWQEMLSHDASGSVFAGSVDALTDAFAQGCEVKVAIRGIYDDLTAAGDNHMDQEVFVQCHSGYYYTDQKLFVTGTHPLVRVRAAIPLTYISHGWDFGWLIVRTDGFISRLLYDPYTLTPHRSQGSGSVRWFVR
jgi:hypothetical protein